jgi:hypothetical protein
MTVSTSYLSFNMTILTPYLNSALARSATTSSILGSAATTKTFTIKSNLKVSNNRSN